MTSDRLAVDVDTLVAQVCKAERAYKMDDIQSLWSGYGAIRRYGLEGAPISSVVAKHIVFPEQVEHPRGWNTEFSHRRKLTSYRVESHWYSGKWYRGKNTPCNEACKTPEAFYWHESEREIIILMEDLDKSGYGVRISDASIDHMKACLSWLANFHACHMVEAPEQLHIEGLWQQGSYWHLATRPDELEALKDEQLRNAAPLIDQKLNASPFQSLVHGDAKLANFCFSDCESKVAAVDFQYVGGGCGMKDVAYFISSCLDEALCEQWESALLDFYFNILGSALAKFEKNIEIEQVEASWRPLYAYAWADFYRFLKGWSPDHWKVHRYSERWCRQVIQELQV